MERIFNLYKETQDEECIGQDKIAREILDNASL